MSRDNEPSGPFGTHWRDYQTIFWIGFFVLLALYRAIESF